VIAAVTGFAQPYPVKPVRIITPGVPFGLTDISARLVALKVTETLGEQVAVQNRVEAGGTVGTAAVARAAPDGYTLLVVDDSHTVNPHLFRNLDYDTIADFAPVSLLARTPLALVVNSHVPARSLMGLVQLAKAKPGLVTFATTGPGSAARLMMEMLKLDAAVSVTNAPYEDAGQALTAVAGGRTDALFITVPGAGDHVASGRIRALAVTSETPNPALPGVPLMKDAFPAFVAYFWIGMLAPAKTPPAIVARVNADVVKVLRSEELKTRLGNLGLETVGSTTGEFDQFLKREVERWGRVIRAQKITLE
jgi:tripartite-type tricarboxylate transporter receptor subunit TctC